MLNTIHFSVNRKLQPQVESFGDPRSQLSSFWVFALRFETFDLNFLVKLNVKNWILKLILKMANQAEKADTMRRL